MIITSQPLLNAGSKSLAVNGSGTPQTFSYSPGGSVAAEITGIAIVMRDEGNTALTNFGARAVLPNGLVLQVTQGGVTRTIATIKDNADLCSVFTFTQFGNAAVLSLLGIVTPQGFGNSNNIFIGFLDFRAGIQSLLVGADSISAVVNDDLSVLNDFRISARIGLD